MPTPSSKAPSRVRLFSLKAYRRIHHLLHIEAFAGSFLVIAAIFALFLANSAYADAYHHFLHLPLSISIGDLTLSTSLHFIINDVLMTIFFLVVGMEIRGEIYNGSLSDPKQASLPVAAALGGILVPAFFYLTFNSTPPTNDGWAVPTATDIAFAVGVLALLGKQIPANVRVFLLSLAIIDDIIAVIVIAIFYSSGLNSIGFLIAAIAILITLLMQRMGISAAFPYILPGALLWFGLLKTGAHPTLAGVILGLLTPVKSLYSEHAPLDIANKAIMRLKENDAAVNTESAALHVAKLRFAQRELMAPVYRVQKQLHLWVAFLIMPFFAFANAGITISEVSLNQAETISIISGIGVALIFGKPAGVLLATWLAIRLGVGKLPEGLTFPWLLLVGCLAGIGFTMSIFIANLAFASPDLLSAAKASVLFSSAMMAAVSLCLGYYLIKKNR